MRISLSPFLQGILGGIVGVFIIFLGFFGFFKIMDKIHTISLSCEKEKITSSRSVECQILEIKDLGNHLKIEDIVSPPPEINRKLLKDEKTTGKFIQVKYKIQNKRKEPIGSPMVNLIDKTNRKYDSSWPLSYWIPQEYQVSSISPGLEKEMIEIFEVAKEAQEPFKIQVKIFRSSFLD